MRNNIVLIFALLISLVMASCRTTKISEKITIKDTVIIPKKIQLDTVFMFKDSIVYLNDSSGQMSIKIEKLKDRYFKVDAVCKPKEIKVEVKKVITKTKQVIVKNYVYKYLFFSLLLFVGIAVLIKKLLV